MARSVFFVFFLLYTVMGVAQPPVAQLPQTYIDTTFNHPTGRTWQAHTSTELKNALNSASPGDSIVLDAGATYIGNFTLPVKLNPLNGWIYIVSAAYAKLPAQGTRVNPVSDAAKMPKLVTVNTQSVLTVPPGAGHYRLVGLEIYTASTAGGGGGQAPYTQSLVNVNSLAGQPLADSVTVDRCYIHASATIDARVGVVANGSNVAVVDSYISDIHQSTNDSQAVLAYSSPGPIKIVNNHLEATGENVMFGGAGGLQNPWVPSDIEIRNNHFYLPMAWDAVGVTLPPGNKWAVKNLLEFKSARRVVVEGNLFENVWPSAQMGFALMFTPRTNSSGLLAVVDDITVRNNILKNVSSGIDTLESDYGCLPANGCTNPGESKRVVITNNLILLGDTTQPGFTGGYAWGALIEHDLMDYVFQHNTVVAPPNLGYCKASWYFEVPPTKATHNIWILDNVLCRQVNGPQGYVGQTAGVLAAYMGGPRTPPNDVTQRFKGNVMYVPPGEKVQQLPPHNFSTDRRITNSNDSEYRLNYPAKMETSDGRVAGVDKSMLVSAYTAQLGNLAVGSEVSTEPPEPKR